jgi:hypothetical protein
MSKPGGGKSHKRLSNQEGRKGRAEMKRCIKMRHESCWDQPPSPEAQGKL